VPAKGLFLDTFGWTKTHFHIFNHIQQKRFLRIEMFFEEMTFFKKSNFFGGHFFWFLEPPAGIEPATFALRVSQGGVVLGD
jgi:hypothetical protein